MDNKADKGNVAGEVRGIHVVAKPIEPICNFNCEFGHGLRGDTRLVLESEQLDPAGWKRFEEGVKTIGAQSIDIFHTLQISIKGSKLQGIVSTVGSRKEWFSFHERSAGHRKGGVEE